jgi:glyoxylase-like metal-dependent hydrolase (beta-lactamase superfamily II)
MTEAKLRVGNVEIVELTDAEGTSSFSLDQLWPSVSAEQWKPFQEKFPAAFGDAEHVHFHYGGFLVRAGGKTILVDTGSGPDGLPALGIGPGKYMDDLKSQGVRPEEVDTVFLTHAHPDHVAWNLTTGGKPTFPNARYVLSQIDWDAFHTPEVQAIFPFPYVAETLTPLQDLGVLDLIAGDTPLGAELTALPAPGHTPGHMALLISSGGEKGLILGDALHNPGQITNPDWKFSFDMDQDVAVASRKALLDRVEADGMTIAQCHLPRPGFGRVVRLDGRRWFQGL